MTTRERAALLMSACASIAPRRVLIQDVSLTLFGYIDVDACELAARAWCSVDGDALDLDGPNDPRRDAEAEAMLRTGWLPIGMSEWTPLRGGGRGAA